MLGVQDQMLQGAESGVALAHVRGLARPAHMKDHARKGQVVGHVERALQFVHGFDAPHTLHFTDRERLAALAGGAKVATGRRVERRQS
jgi:hypothetical protein